MGRVAQRRLAHLAARMLLAVCAAHDARAQKPAQSLVIVADVDDDDGDGIADGRAPAPTPASLQGAYWLDGLGAGARFAGVEGDSLRLLSATGLLKVGARLPDRVGIQGIHAGTVSVVLAGRALQVAVLEPFAVDEHGVVIDLARSHAALSRVLPPPLADPDSAPAGDRDALAWLIAGPEPNLPRHVKVVSLRPGGALLDQLESVPTANAACPPQVPAGFRCRRTPLIRAVVDAIDRSHPASQGRSLRAEVGGLLALHLDGRKAASIRVGGPRNTRLGPLERYRGRLRVRIVRVESGGAPPIGGDVAGALALAQEEVRMASSLWGQCGIHFGLPRDLDIKVIDPPPAHMVAIGCDFGMPASGGEVAFRAGGRELHVRTHAGQTPTEVANAVADAAHKAGLRAELSANARIAPGALRTADVLVKKPDGTPAAIELASGGQPLSNDATLQVCLGEVNLADGLSHFTDFDAIAGTVEERALIKAVGDLDPSTIDVLIVSNFAPSGRIGESFIYGDGASIRNVVIIDRAGVRAGARSYALAHELGHILLDMPDHPDDFGVDHPEALMDADAADATIFGPRRLSIAECERAILQNGPAAPLPLLDDWPLFRRALPGATGIRSQIQAPPQSRAKAAFERRAPR